MEAVFLNILELSLRGSLLILAILPIRALLKKAPRWSICLLWVLAAIALVCPIRFESTASVVPADSIITEIIAPAPTMPLVQSEPILIQDLPVENGVHIITHTEPDYAFIAAMVWLMGMAVMLSVAAVSYVRLKKQVAASLPVKDKVYLCDDIDTPFILGIVRPRIYLPSALDTALYPSVLLHEYAHLKRRDHWWKPLGYLLLTVHWFNPLVWLGYVLLCRDIELACDEKVIRDMDGQHKKHYSEALLQCSMPRHLITACPLAFGEVGAKQRIKAVLSYKKPAFWVILIVLVLCVVLALGFLTDPKVTTLGELSGFSAEMSFIYAYDGTYVDEDSIRSAIDTDHVREELAQVEIRWQIAPLFEYYDDWNVIALYPQDEKTFHRLGIAPDFSALRLISFTETDSGQFSHKSPYYEVSNPALLESIFRDDNLFAPSVTTLGKLSHMTAEDIKVVTLWETNRETTRSVSSASIVEDVCAQLSQLELRSHAYINTPNLDGDMIILLPHADGPYYHLCFNATHTLLGVLKLENLSESETRRVETYYEVLDPQSAIDIVRSDAFYQAGIPEDATQMEFSFTPAVLETVITEYLGNKNKNIANLTRIGNVFSDGNTYYTVVSMDYTARDGSVVAENQLYLAQLRWMDASPKGYFLVEGLAKGEWSSSAGYYPNVADFGGQTVIWTTRNATHLKVFDGGVGSDGTVPNEYDTYRITCASGATYDWKAQNATGVYLLPTGETPVRVAPLYNNKGYEVSAFSFDMSNIETVDVRTISQQSGWNLFMEMDASTGTILELYSNPVSDPPAPDTHESLLTTAVSKALHFHTDLPIAVTIEGEAEYKGRHFAMVQVLNDVYVRYLVEYTVTDSGYQITAWDAVNSLDPNAGTIGYSVSFATFHGTKLGWIHTVPNRSATSADGTAIINGRQSTDYTAIRFTMADGKTIDTKLPKDLTKDRLALQVFDTGTPLSAVPLVGKTQVTACAIEFTEIGGYGEIANGFFGHEALLSALRSHPELTHWDKKSLVLLGQQRYGDYEYAVISHDDHEAVLVEYTLSGDTATLLNYAVGYAPDTSGMRTGYHMNESNMEGGILYWSLYAPRYKVTPNGKDVDESLETVTPDFSGFRFTMRDLKTHDFPADDSFFLCEFTGVIPPSLVTPMEKGKLLAALGSEFSGGLTGTISLKG